MWGSGPKVSADRGSAAAGRDIIGDVTIGLTSEHVKDFIEAAARGARGGPLMIPDTPDIAYPITLPLHIDFDAGIDDPRIFTPPLAPRRLALLAPFCCAQYRPMKFIAIFGRHRIDHERNWHRCLNSPPT
jgi:hypothetical protein